MKKTPVNFRLSQDTLYNLDQLQEILGFDRTLLVEDAIEHYLDAVLHVDVNTVCCDFYRNLKGINTDLVVTFIEQVNDYTCFKTYMYGNGDQIYFSLKEEP